MKPLADKSIMTRSMRGTTMTGEDEIFRENPVPVSLYPPWTNLGSNGLPNNSLT
jgi:hypothetical protein